MIALRRLLLCILVAAISIDSCLGKHKSHSKHSKYAKSRLDHHKKAGGKGRSHKCTKRDVPSYHWPTPKGTVEVTKTITVTDKFDGGMKEYVSHGLGSGDQGEAQQAIFVLADGATLSNVIIGGPAADGIHCLGSCDILNVYCEDVGEDFITFKGTNNNIVGNIIGGGARKASDKVIQFNSGGTIKVQNYIFDGFSKGVRDCGNCKHSCQRNVIMKDIIAINGNSALVAINKDLNDTAYVSNVKVYGKQIPLCVDYTSTSVGKESVNDNTDAYGCNVDGGKSSSGNESSFSGSEKGSTYRSGESNTSSSSKSSADKYSGSKSPGSKTPGSESSGSKSSGSESDDGSDEDGNATGDDGDDDDDDGC